MYLFVLFLFFLRLIVKSLIIFWRFFLILTIIFIFFMKFEGNVINLLNYFVLQEIAGLFFLFFKNLVLQILIVLLKVGVSPFHFWIFSVLLGLRINLIFWFITFQKLVYIRFIINWGLSFFFLFLLGIFFCFVQILFLFNFLKVFILNLTESLNWVLLFFVRSLFENLFLVIYYLFLFIILMNRNLKDGGQNWLIILFFLNIPLRFNFFVKIFVLSRLLEIRFLFLFFLLFFIVLRVLGLLKVLFRLNLNFNNQKILNRNFYLIFIQFLFLFYYFSKINYIILIR